MADLDALLSEMDAERPCWLGWRCWTCTGPEEVREFVERARAAGHSYGRIAQKCREAFGVVIGETALRAHCVNHVRT